MDAIKDLFGIIEYHCRKYSYLIAPLLSIIILCIIRRLFNITFTIDADFYNNISNISGILVGYLMTIYGIFVALVDNRFIKYLKTSGHLTIIYRIMIFGIFFLIVSMLLALFKLSNTFMIVSFICGLSEVMMSVYYFYRVTTLSSKSN